MINIFINFYVLNLSIPITCENFNLNFFFEKLLPKKERKGRNNNDEKM